MPRPLTFDKVVARILHVGDILHHRLVMGRPPASSDSSSLEARDPIELEDQLFSFVLGLPPGYLYVLLAVYAVALGYYEPGDFLNAYESASNHFPIQREAADALMEKAPLLAYHLRYGLQRLARAGIDIHFISSFKPASDKGAGGA